MSIAKYLSTSQWLHWEEIAVSTLVGWMPFPTGKAVRRLIYRVIFARIGTSVQIEPGVEFARAWGIELGNGVKIDRGVCLRNHGQNSRIYLGDYVKLDVGVMIKTHFDGDIYIGNNTYIGPYTCLSGNYIKIGKDCRIASHIGIYANDHNFADPSLKIRKQGNSYKGIVIEDDCWLGSGVKVVDGVTIGEGSVIGAGAVVTKDIPSYSVAVGVPARTISNRKSNKNINEQYEKTSKGEETTELLIEHSLQALTDTPLQLNILHQLLNSIRQVMAVDTVTVLLQAKESQQLAVYATLGLEEEITEGIQIPVGCGFAGNVANRCEPVIVDNLSTVEVVSHILRNKGIQSMVGVPLLYQNQAIGVFHVGTFRSRKFTHNEVQLLQLVANRISSAIACSEMLHFSIAQDTKLVRHKSGVVSSCPSTKQIVQSVLQKLRMIDIYSSWKLIVYRSQFSVS